MRSRLPISVRTCLQIACAIAASAICCAASVDAADNQTRLNGTFLQLTARHKSWTDAQWTQLFDYLHQLQLSNVFVQWTAYDDISFYRSAPEMSGSPLDKILSNANRTGLKVWVGLYSNSGYWDRIGQGSAAAANYLDNVRAKSLAIARDLAPALKQDSAFAVWYLPEEIDDVNWESPQARSQLLRHLDLTSAEIHRLTPGACIAISTFSNARISPRQFRTFWEDAFHSTTVTAVLLQDGVGAQKLELNEFPLYAEALSAAARSAGRQFGIIVELFQQTGGPPVDSGSFQASSARWDRVCRQLQIAHRFTNSVIGFSIPEYMTPLGAQGAEQLYTDYLRDLTKSPAMAPLPSRAPITKSITSEIQ